MPYYLFIGNRKESPSSLGMATRGEDEGEDGGRVI
jgi:hypothetical protein